MKIEARLTRDSFAVGSTHEDHLVISLSAPESTLTRPSICVVPVVDTSGSMQGEKIAYARQSVVKLIEHLSDKDYVGLVSFSSSARVLIKPRVADTSNKQAMRAEVNKLYASGGTNLADGILQALQAVRDLDLPESTILRVIIFTDGQANEGIATKPAELLALQAAHKGRVTLSAFGYGDGGGIDQDFLVDFAKQGGGNYAYVKDPDAALAAFGTELGGLLSTYATGITITVAPLAGHQIVEVVSDVDADAADPTGEVVIRLPDILAQETRNLVLKVQLKEQENALPRAVNLFESKVKYLTLGSGGSTEQHADEVKTKAKWVKSGEEQAKPDKALDAVVALAQLVRAQLQAEAQAKAGNFAGAQVHVQSMAASFSARGHEALNKTAGLIGARLGDSGSYAASSGYLRSLNAGMTRGFGVASYDASAQSDLEGLGVQLSNASMNETSTSFQAGPEDAQAMAIPAVVTSDSSVPPLFPGVISVPAAKPIKARRQGW
jgi:Mg-chelatase subunit ChlD